MEWLITNAIAAWLLPPGFVFVMLLAALVLARRPWLARGLVAFSFIALYALSTPFVAGQLRQWLESAPRDPLSDKSGGAIVILGGGTYVNAPEYGGDTPSVETLARLRYGAHLYRALKKPVLVTGGTVLGNVPEAVAMKSVPTASARTAPSERQMRNSPFMIASSAPLRPSAPATADKWPPPHAAQTRKGQTPNPPTSAVGFAEKRFTAAEGASASAPVAGREGTGRHARLA